MELDGIDQSGAYFLYHDASGNLGMTDQEAKIPAGATHIHRIEKDAAKQSHGFVSQMQELLPTGLQHSIPAPVQHALETAHMSPVVGIGIAAAAIVILRSSFLRMLAFKAAFGLMGLAIVGSAYMMFLGKTTHTANQPLNPAALLQAAQESSEQVRRAADGQTRTLDAIANEK